MGEYFLAVRNSLTCETLSVDSQCEIVVFKLFTDSPYSIIICSIYRPPNYNMFKSFTQIVDLPTRGTNILDIFCTNRPALTNKCFPIPGISDHEALYVESHISIPSSSNIKRKICLWPKANFSDIQQVASDTCTTFLQKRFPHTWY